MSDSKPDAYSTDAPISTHGEDRFSRWPFARRVASVLATRKDPGNLVVGIYGPWGDGKTSALNMIIEAMAGHADVVVVRFNPWHFESDEQLIKALFNTLAAAIDHALPTAQEKVGSFLKRYGGLLSLASVTVGQVVSVSAGDAAQSFGEQLSAVGLDDLKARIDGALRASGKRVVVLIDDVDRLDKSEIQTLLKLVRLSAGFDQTAYVLAFDPDVVAASLGDRYGRGDAKAGQQFLEKIVQVPLHLPNAEAEDLVKLAFDGINEVLGANDLEPTPPEIERFVVAFRRGILPALRTPRQVKRFVNAITFAVPLLHDEVNSVDLLLLEAVRSVFPGVYLSIRDNGEAFLRSEKSLTRSLAAADQAESKKVIEDALQTVAPSDREAAIEVLKALLPRVEGMLKGTHYESGVNQRWFLDRRLSSSEYFRRYFQYTVPRRDVSDATPRGLVSAANLEDRAAMQSLLSEITERQAWHAALDRLFQLKRQLSAKGACTLAEELARVGACIPEETGPFSIFSSPRGRAASLSTRMDSGDLTRSVLWPSTRGFLCSRRSDRFFPRIRHSSR